MRPPADVSVPDDPMPVADPVVEGLTRLHTLADGRRVLVRPLAATDRAQLVEGYAQLSGATRRRRFGSAPDRLGPGQLDRLVDLDYADRLALAAVLIDEPGTPGVGVARYKRDGEDPTTAEAAVVVLDAYQRHGIGTVLLWDLVEAARARGIRRFTATVAWENADLLAGLRASGAAVEPAEPGVAAVSFELPQEYTP